MEKYTIVSPNSVWACSSGDRPLRFASHSPASVVNGVRTAVITASVSTSHTNRWRAAGQNVHDDRENGGERSQDNDEMHEQDVGGQPVERRQLSLLEMTQGFWKMICHQLQTRACLSVTGSPVDVGDQ